MASKLSAKLNRHALPLSMICLIGATAYQTYISLDWGHATWQMTEWLINYAGGFVRRGLPGYLIGKISSTTGLHQNIIAIAASLITYIALTSILVLKSKDKVPLILISSPVVLGAAAYQMFMIRKDSLGLFIFALCLMIECSNWRFAMKFILCNTMGVLTLLSHEGFFFYGFSSLFWSRLQTLRVNQQPSDWRTIPIAAAAYSPMIIAFILVILHHGTASEAQAINQSLLDVWQQINPGMCCLTQPSGAIDALQWTTMQGLSVSYRVLSEFTDGIYTPIAWIISLAICCLFIVSFIGSSDQASDQSTQSKKSIIRQDILGILLTQLIFTSPLFALGWEFGRWIFMWTISSILIYIYRPASSRGYDYNLLGHITSTIEKTRFMQLRVQPWHLFIFGIPRCCWSIHGYIQATPIGFYIGELVKWLIGYKAK